MCYKYLLLNVYKNVYKIHMYQHNIINIGSCTFSILNKKESSICNLYININYRKNNNGTLLLSTTESILQNKYNIIKVNLLAYESSPNTLVKFYTKCGYNLNKNQKEIYYDDGVILYTISKMYKELI